MLKLVKKQDVSRVNMQTIKKRASVSTPPIYFDDLGEEKEGKFAARVTEGFDDGEVYETGDVSDKYFSYHIFYT